MLRDVSPQLQGRIGLWKVHEVRGRNLGQVLHRWVEPITYCSNQIQYDWGLIAANALGIGDTSYRISAMYIEFENVASPGDPVSIPAFGRDEGTEYYDNLQSSGSRDFLRVPLIQQPLIGAAGASDEFTKMTFFSLSQGTEGVHGKTFSDGVNSKVFGAALVATPVFADRTQDIVFARGYYAVSEQTLKEASHQVGLTWEVTLK